MLRRSLALLIAAAAGCGAPSSVDTALDALAAPAWLGNAQFAITRSTCNDGRVCDVDLHPLADGFEFGSWAAQRAGITAGFFEVWQPGVTDRPNPDLWQQLDARLYYRTDPNAAFSFRWVNFLESAGNNARYSFSLRELDPFFDPSRNGRFPLGSAGECPTFPIRIAEDGITMQADVEMYISVNGAELRPSAGQSFVGTYSILPSVPGICAPTATTVIDQTGGDVTVLSARFGDNVTSAVQGAPVGGLRFDPALCDGTDCTEAVRAIIQGAPFVNRFIYPGTSSGLCELIEIQTVTRRSALDAATFSGVGFYFANAFAFVPTQDLLAVRDVTLRDGSPAVVHRFVAQGMCFGQGGNSGSIMERRFEFKPFARFDVVSTLTQYRVWDYVSDDYLLGRTRSTNYFFVSSFDRQAELIQ